MSPALYPATALPLVLALALLSPCACGAAATPAEADGRRSCPVASECSPPAVLHGDSAPHEETYAPNHSPPSISSPLSPPPLTSAPPATAFRPAAHSSPSPCPPHPVAGPSESLYHLLALPRTASWEDVQSAHDACLATWWRAAAAEAPEASQRRAVQLEQAYRVLSNSRLRRLYDVLGEDDVAHAAYDVALTGGGGNVGRADEERTHGGTSEGMHPDWTCCEWLVDRSNGGGAGSEGSGHSGREGQGESERSECARHPHHHSLPAVCCSPSAAHHLPHSLPLATTCAARIFDSLLPLSPHATLLRPSPAPLTATHPWLRASVPITARNIVDRVFASAHPWLLLLFSRSSPRSLALLPAWSALAVQLKGIARLGHVDAGEHTQVALRLAERTCLAAKRLFAAGLPEVVGRPAGCRHVDCLVRLRRRAGRKRWVGWVAGRAREEEEEDDGEGDEGGEGGTEGRDELLMGDVWGKGKADGGGGTVSKESRAANGALSADPLARLREFLIASGEVLGHAEAARESDSGAGRTAGTAAAAGVPDVGGDGGERGDADESGGEGRKSNGARAPTAAPSPTTPSPPSHTANPEAPTHSSPSLLSLLHLSPSSPYHHLNAPPPPLPSLRQLRRFAFLSLLRVPPIPVVPLPHLPARFFRLAPDRQVRFVLLLPPGRRAASLEARYWAGSSVGLVAWVAVPWQEGDAAAWQRWWRVQRAPALGIYRDPGVAPMVVQGPLNSTVLRHALQRFASFLLPHLTASSAARLACDPSAPSAPPPYFLTALLSPPREAGHGARAGSDGQGRAAGAWRAKKERARCEAGRAAEGGGDGRRRVAREREGRMRTRYCVVVVGTPSPALHRARAALLDIQEAVAVAVAAAAAAADDGDDEDDGAAACDMDNSDDSDNYGNGGVDVKDSAVATAGSATDAASATPAAALRAAHATDSLTCAAATGGAAAHTTAGRGGGGTVAAAAGLQQEAVTAAAAHGGDARSIPPALLAAAREGRVAMAWLDGSVQVQWCAYMLGWHGAQWCQKHGRPAAVGAFMTRMRWGGAGDRGQGRGKGGERRGDRREEVVIGDGVRDSIGLDEGGVEAGDWDDGDDVDDEDDYESEGEDGSERQRGSRPWVVVSVYGGVVDGSNRTGMVEWINHALHTGDAATPQPSPQHDSKQGNTHGDSSGDSRRASGNAAKNLLFGLGPSVQPPRLIDEDAPGMLQSLHHLALSSLSSLHSSSTAALHRFLCSYLLRPLLPLLPAHWLHAAAAAAELAREVVGAAVAGGAAVAEGDGGLLRTLALAIAARYALKMVLAHRRAGGRGDGARDTAGGREEGSGRKMVEGKKEWRQAKEQPREKEGGMWREVRGGEGRREERRGAGEEGNEPGRRVG
ncbi:hypothetical protein CLOM_g14460 [Closterium sp. NIES-68]|nr:hypothetical protein CLOM_g14460 [Closterium sp. NIES-68]GJP59867.1 hypothetical protein CLOP_g15662 [Closterium sp. NIES-67]